MSVRVDKLPSRFSGQQWPSLPGFKRVNVCSGAPGIWKELSPMRLGPVVLADWDVFPEDDPGVWFRGIAMPSLALNLENAWQFSKVWESEEAADGWPADVFFERRSVGWSDPKGHRWVKKGRGPNPNVPLYLLWGDRKLSYLEARRVVYCPIYSALVKETEAFHRLHEWVVDGKNVLILGYDGYDRGSASWRDCFLDTSRPFGHELILGALLDECDPLPWEEN